MLVQQLSALWVLTVTSMWLKQMEVLLAVQLLHVAQHIPMNIDVCKLLIFAGKLSVTTNRNRKKVSGFTFM